jgi:hypothetical protein
VLAISFLSSARSAVRVIGGGSEVAGRRCKKVAERGGRAKIYKSFVTVCFFWATVTTHPLRVDIADRNGACHRFSVLYDHHPVLVEVALRCVGGCASDREVVSTRRHVNELIVVSSVPLSACACVGLSQQE